jgi:hypothetical protein
MKLGDNVVAVLLHAETLPIERFHNRGNLPHVLETVASSMLMLSRLGFWLLIV